MKPAHRPRKRFGQNFLADAGVVERLAACIAARPGEHVVEIGAGRGELTRALADSGARLDLVELDRDLTPLLARRFGQRATVRIHNADALRVDYAALADRRGAGGGLRVVGNLPYNISTPLLFHLLSFSELLADMHFLLQLEVVERLAARPGGKTWGKLGVMAQFQCRVDRLFEVPASAFRPRPKVRSAVARLVPRRLSAAERSLLEPLSRVARAAFSARRKTLRNALRGLLPAPALHELGVEPGARAETLALAQFVRLAERLRGQHRPPSTHAEAPHGDLRGR